MAALGAAQPLGTLQGYWPRPSSSTGPGTSRRLTQPTLHTGYVEAVNSLLQAAKAKARGYGTTDHFIAMAFLNRRQTYPPAGQSSAKSKGLTMDSVGNVVRHPK